MRVSPSSRKFSTRPATSDDVDALADLVMQKAQARKAADPAFWRDAQDPRDQICAAICATLGTSNPPFRQAWSVVEDDRGPIGVSHAIHVPVPPIYAGDFGAPGLIMDDTCADAEAAPALIRAAEADLEGAGAKVFLAAASQGSALLPEYRDRGYRPLTLYMARSGLRAGDRAEEVHPATEAHLPDIVSQSARNRQVLHDLHDFWKPHEDADPRFRAWMAKSLTLGDRDMQVAISGGAVTGYVISQPATRLHIPPAHGTEGLGFIDDFYDVSLNDAAAPEPSGTGAAALLHAAEGALSARGYDRALVVCPADWTSKIALLEAAGYRTVLTWYIRDGQPTR